MMDSPIECLCPLAARLGESPVWVTDRQTLRFSGINGRRLHRGLFAMRLDVPGPARPLFDPDA